MGVPDRGGGAPAFVRERLTGLAGTRWVGIDGKGASGKTTLAAAVAAALPGAVVGARRRLRAAVGRDWERDRFVAQVLVPLAAGRPARYERWDWGDRRVGRGGPRSRSACRSWSRACRAPTSASGFRGT